MTVQAATMPELIGRMGEWGERELFLHTDGFDIRSWSYGRAIATARRVVALLGRKGVAPGDRVMLWAPNSPEWATTFLGCFLAGVVPVPIDLRFRPPFLREVASQTEASLLFITQARTNPLSGIQAIALESLEETLEGVGGEAFQPAQPSADDMAEIVYTSGTTAHPRGVVLTHRNLMSELEAFQPVVPTEPEYRFLSVLPLSHIFEQMGGLLLPISRGGTVIYPATVRPSTLLRVLRREHPNAMMVVPRFMELLQDRILREIRSRPPVELAFRALLTLSPHLPLTARRWLFRPVLRDLGGCLKYLVSGGAPLDPGLEAFWESVGMIVLQGYGLTETASAVTCTRVGDTRLGSVGKPLSNQEIRLAADGEILVRGENVTPGYYRRPDLTADAFEDGWLKTGDVGFLDSDGYLYIRGRKKEMIVTSSGVNVYPEDVERVLNQLPGVRDSAAVEWKGKVHAVLLLDPGVDPRLIVRQANLRLDPSQRIQGHTVWPYPDFPRTATMKVRKASVLDYLRSRGAEAA